jgi:predicted transcriptional regulator
MPKFESPASDSMVSPVATIGLDAKLDQAYETMIELGISGLPVVDADARLVGVISRTDLLRAGRFRNPAGKNRDRALTLPDARVSEHMSSGAATVSRDTELAEVARTMAKKHFHRMYVAEEGRAIGVIGTAEMMQAVVDVRANRPIGDLASDKLIALRVDDPVSLAVDRLAATHVSGLVVLEDGWPVGVFRQTEALAAREAPADAPVEDWMSSAFLCMPASVPSHRAATQALDTKARRVLVTEGAEVIGVASGLDFCRLVAGKV